MPRLRTHREIEALVALARTYCEAQASYRYARAEGRLSAVDEKRAMERLNLLDAEIERLKGNDELGRRRTLRAENIVRLPSHLRIAK